MSLDRRSKQLTSDLERLRKTLPLESLSVEQKTRMLRDYKALYGEEGLSDLLLLVEPKETRAQIIKAIGFQVTRCTAMNIADCARQCSLGDNPSCEEEGVARLSAALVGRWIVRDGWQKTVIELAAHGRGTCSSRAYKDDHWQEEVVQTVSVEVSSGGRVKFDVQPGYTSLCKDLVGRGPWVASSQSGSLTLMSRNSTYASNSFGRLDLDREKR